MRLQSYQIAKIVAWPALAWCTMEAVLRVALGEPALAMQPALLAACAAGMVTAASIRRRQLEAASAPQG
ncbi:MAG: hypothetical protein IT303_03460 [Dehalococcoidia bacterium]|nr:hypothetical protein [Dehalococcoidia bacterium]